jgi:uncharacterized delta-60 repeat protein
MMTLSRASEATPDFTTVVPAGNLDTTGFNAPYGYETISFGDSASQESWGVAVQSDSKIVVVGQNILEDASSDFALARYNSDGSPDTGFGTGGSVTTDFSGDYDAAYALAIQPDDKIIVAGRAYNTDRDYFALARYNLNGNLDSTFGSGGKVLTNFTWTYTWNDDRIQAIVIQPDGKIVVAGYIATYDPYYPDDRLYDFALLRYNINGSLDNTFGNGGITTTDFGDNDFGYAVALQEDGKIVVAGATGNPGATCESVCDIAVASYNPDGSPDTTFGSNGKVTTRFFGFDEEAHTVAVQSDGKIVAAGYVCSSISCDIALVRYNPDSSLDPTFDSDGKVTTDFDGGFDGALAMTIQPDGKIIAAGFIERDKIRYSAVVRYNADGSLDPEFGAGGIADNDFGYNNVYAIALQSDGKIVTTGYMILARYLGKAIIQTYIPMLMR